MSSKPSSAALALTAALAAVFLLTRSNAAEAAAPDEWAGGDADTGANDWGFVDGDFSGDPYNPQPVFYEPDMSTQLKAFLFMIKTAEHTPTSVRMGLEYGTFYSGLRFRNFADHPVITGEMRGVPLTATQCRNAGLSPGCVSTAAGAYQIIRPTWLRVREAGRWGPRLPDFSPASQDEAARRLLIECRALPLLESGDWRAAVLRAGSLWASLPGSTAKQNPKDFETVAAYFQQGGGVLA